MRKTYYHLSKFEGFLLLLMLAFFIGLMSSVQAEEIRDMPPGLFLDSATENAFDRLDAPIIIRTRPVQIRLDLVRGKDALMKAQDDTAGVLNLNLFHDVSFIALLDRVESHPSGSFSWIGYIEGVELSEVILVVRDGIMVGNVRMPGACYQIRHAGDGLHAIREIDQSAFPPELEPVPVNTSDDVDAGLDVQRDDNGSLIDVLVVYTGAALSAAGRPPHVQA